MRVLEHDVTGDAYVYTTNPNKKYRIIVYKENWEEKFDIELDSEAIAVRIMETEGD